MASDEQRVLIIQLYQKGATLDEIAHAASVRSRQRVQQLLDQYGIPRSDRFDRLYNHSFPARAEEVEALFLRLRDDRAVSERTGIDERCIRRFINSGRIPDPDVLRRRPRARQALFTDEELVECLRAAAKELAPPMAHARYAEWASGRMLDGQRRWPGPQSMMIRFGSWRSALARAGLPANPTGGPDPHYDLSDAVSAIAQAWRETGTPPTGEAYTAWRAGRRELPSFPTMRRLVEDGWDMLKLAAWPIVHGRQLPGVGSQEPGAADEVVTGGGVGGQYRRANETPNIEPSDPFERDPQQIERSLGAHNALQNRLADLAHKKSYEPLSPLALDPEFDLAWRTPDGTLVLVEVKSANASNLEGQLRLGLGQVLRYGEILRDRDENVRHVLAIELEPADGRWRSLLARLGVRLVTPGTLDDAFTD
jgi:hypothetical protein